MTKKLAVIAGATGVIGRGLADTLARRPDWDVVALARRPVEVPGVRFIPVDLTDTAACRARLTGLEGATHLLYAGRFDHVANQPEPVETNLAMLRNVLEPLEAQAPGLAHVHLVHGTKWYGSDIGPFPTPAREDDPRSVRTTFYYAQQDYVAARQPGRSWTWSASRPHGICHAVPDTPRNLVLVIAVYALICREMGLPLCFPGTEANYRALYQCTSSDHLVDAILWMSETPACANQAFNIINGDHIRWERLWPAFARHFGMEVGPVKTVKLAAAMADKAPVWDAIVRRHGLKAPPYERLALWSYGDFVFGPHWDMMSDMTKARQAGFTRTVRTEDEFIRYFNVFSKAGVLP
ncbi:SDR family oxidoreductase [Aquabacter spiritensis]|uniref:Nucleoside-diphosphate-sugar epimerase n=1 Tax=Aquabacter spiritensis TaxID=933073 RepID=A0A4R3M0V0_9HYPH|nr:SDR family oxidoreductase [Aquabacter spiritensis]TCT06226.1 nucleoside-diphosphate-sugar epimerase [Aquabacter spiritensis]